MSDIQQISENTLLWFILAAIFNLLWLIIWLFQTVKIGEPTVSDYYRNYNDGRGYLLNEELYNKALYRYKKCNNKRRWFILCFDYVNK